MKLITLLYISLFFVQDPVKIPWMADEKLTWEDFKGKPDHNSPFAASTHSSIIFSYNVVSENENLFLTTKTDAYFYPEMSWFKPDQVNVHILKHEQAHFDITEIHARKLRKAFSEYKVTRNFERELSSIFTRINQDRQKMQQRFDKETNHSRNYEKEAEWQKNIAEKLAELDQWKN